MFFCGKKIIYLNDYENDIKGSLAGFVRSFRENDMLRLDITLQKLCQWENGKYRTILEGNGKRIFLGEIKLWQGEGKEIWKLPVKDGYIYWGEQEIPLESVCGITIQNHHGKKIGGYWKKQEAECISAEKIIENYNHEKVENYSDNKWEQLCKTYPKVHPFGEESVFISIEPKDFVLLRASYQKLVNNSFLLHGYYNYRHLILGPSREVNAEKPYCLGVPGNFYEREKMVAVMFGFEGFECNGPVEIGRFGYYMRGVEL